MYRVGASASEPNLSKMAVVVTARVNRPHNRLETLSTKAAGTKIVSNISMMFMTGLITLFTVLAMVLWVAHPFALTSCDEPLIIMTVLLIMTVTVRTNLNKANAPTENFKVDTIVSALTREMGTAT